jgi:hypothetical protein
MTCAAYYNAPVTLSRTPLCAVVLAVGCGSSNVSPPDLGAPADMHIAGPTTLATTQTLTNCLATDGSFVYWSDSTPAIMKVAVAGGAATQVAAGGDKNGCVAADGSGVYYVDVDKIMMAPSSGGGAAPLASGQHALKGAPLVAAGGFVYWITDVYGDVDAYNGKNAIVRVPVTGGAVQIVSALVAGNPGGLAVDDTNVYYSDQMGVFARALAAPATAISFGQSALHDNALAVGGGHLAMSEIVSIGSGDVAVFRTDGMLRVIVSPSLAQPLAVDDRGVYINDAGALDRLALDGSGPTPLATQPPRAVTLAAATIFFTDGTAIYSLPK